jgi:hypothetical protein
LKLKYLKNTFETFANTLRNKLITFNDNTQLEHHTLHKKSKTWEPKNHKDYINNPESIDLEHYIKKTHTLLEKEYNIIYNKKNKTKYNLTKTHRKLIHNLKNNKLDYHIDLQDKNIGFIIDNDKNHDINTFTHLHSNTYKKTLSLPFTNITHHINVTIEEYKDLINPKTIKFLKQFNFQTSITPTCKIYYKTLKFKEDKTPTRPVSTNYNFITSGISIYLSFHLSKLLHLIPTYITSSIDIIKIINSNTYSSNHYLFTFDITNMYPNINNEIGIIALTWFLDEYTNLDTRIKELYIILAKIILNYSYIAYKNEIYKQIDGTAMGTNFAVCYATIYLFYINHTYYEKYKYNIAFIKCFVDDGCGLWTGTINDLLNFLSDLNLLPDNTIKSNPNHKITYMISNTSIDFLDLTLFFNYNIIQYKPYNKPLEKHMLQLHSFHPHHIHSNWIINQINTLYTHSSTNKIFHEAKKHLLTTLLKSNINNSKPHNKRIKQTLTKIFTNNNKSNNNNKIKNDKAKIYYTITNNPILQQLKLPTLLNTYKELLPPTIENKYDFTLTYKSPPNLSKLICHKIKTTENSIYIPNTDMNDLKHKFNSLKISNTMNELEHNFNNLEI